jgi:outer membrane immunogenic protein
MKKLLLGTAALVALATANPAFSADLPAKAPVYAPAWSWTGFYFGGHIGAGWARKDWVFDASGLLGGINFPGNSNIGGYVGGGQLGFNYQSGQLVWGAEVSLSAAEIEGDAKCVVGTALCNTRVDWLGTATIRLGYAADRLLAYVKGGAAWAHDNYRISSTNFVNVLEAKHTRWGGTVGAGLEYAFNQAWSAKVEYDYLGLGTRRVTLVDQFNIRYPVDIRQDIHIFQLGVNYRFDWASPVVARY